MAELEKTLLEVCQQLKMQLHLLQESGLTYIPKQKESEKVVTSDNNNECSKSLLEALERKLSDCTRCKLCNERNNIVFGVGNPQAEIVFVGEGPGAEEDKQGEPFVGRAGKLLTKMINAMGYERSDVYICNVVKCRPPQNRDPQPDEIEQCEPFLKQQLELINPKVIIGLGRYACQTLLQTTTPMSRIRGQWQSYNGIAFMPTFHPAYLLRNPPAKKYVWEDLQAVLAKIK